MTLDSLSGNLAHLLTVLLAQFLTRMFSLKCFRSSALHYIILQIKYLHLVTLYKALLALLLFCHLLLLRIKP